MSATVLNAAKHNVDIMTKDVSAITEAKDEINEFVQYLKKPDKCNELGTKITMGSLMHGSPGTETALLAKVTAGEAGVPFLTMSGSEYANVRRRWPVPCAGPFCASVVYGTMYHTFE